MAEYVSRDDVRRFIADAFSENRFATNYDYAILVDKMDEIPTSDVQPVDRWISVKDRLPEEQQCILAYEKDYGVMWGDYQGIKYSQPVWIVRKQGLIIRTTEVTHWQPLPEQPQD